MEPVATVAPHIATAPSYSIAGSYRLPTQVYTTGASTMSAAYTVNQPKVTYMSAAPAVTSPVSVPYSVSHALGYAEPYQVSSTPYYAATTTVPGTPPLSVPGGGFKFYGPHESNPLEEIEYEQHSQFQLTQMQPDVPPPPPTVYQDTDRYEAMLQASARHVEELSHQPHTAENLEAQIQELIEGQRVLQRELEQVKSHCHNNHMTLEDMRQQAQQMAYSPQDWSYPPQPQDVMLPMEPKGSPLASSMMRSQSPRGRPRAHDNLGYEDTTMGDAMSKLHQQGSAASRGAFQSVMRALNTGTDSGRR